MEIGWKWYLPQAEYPEYSFGTVDYLYGEPLGTAVPCEAYGVIGQFIALN